MPGLIGVANRRSTRVLRKSVLFWPWTIPAKLQVLALDEDAGVQEHVQQEPRLTFGEAGRRDGFHPLSIGQVEGPAIGFRRQHHRINSSAIRGCPSATAATADRASDREIARESGLGGATGVGPAVVAGHDLEILVPRAAVAVFVLDTRIWEPDVPIVVRQLVFSRPACNFFGLAVRPAIAVLLASVALVQEALIVALELVVEYHAPNPTALAAETFLGGLVGAIARSCR